MTATRPAALVPWIVLGLMLAYNAWYVGRYSANIPRADEWRDVSVLLGDQPLSLHWLWTPHSVHRIPLPRLIRFGLYRLSGRDFRSALVFNVAVMALAAALLIRLATRIRGRPSALDAVFPLLLLGPGHYMTFLWAFQVQFAASVALFFAAVVLLLSKAEPPAPGMLALLALTVVLQVLTGANGLALALPLVVWLVAALVRTRTPRTAPWWIAAALCLAAIIVIGVYPRGLPAAGSLPPLGLAVQTFLQFVSTGLATGERFWVPRAAILCVLITLALVAALRVARRAPSERWRTSGLLACFAAALLVAASVAIGRAELTTGAGLHARYTTLAITFACLTYLTFVLYPGGAIATLVPKVIVVLSVLTTFLVTFTARGYGEFRLAQLIALKKDADRGLPIEVIAARNGPAIFQYSPGTATYLSRLVAHRSWPFEAYRPDPRVHAQVIRRRRLALDEATLHDLIRDGQGFRPTGPNPQLILRLADRSQVAGIELRYRLDGPPGRLMRLELRWDEAGGTDPSFPLNNVGSFPVYATVRPQSITAWLYGTVASVCVSPDSAARRIDIDEIVLHLLPPAWDGGPATQPSVLPR